MTFMILSLAEKFFLNIEYDIFCRLRVLSLNHKQYERYKHVRTI